MSSATSSRTRRVFHNCAKDYDHHRSNHWENTTIWPDFGLAHAPSLSTYARQGSANGQSTRIKGSETLEIEMKKTLIAFLLLAGTAAFGQAASVLSSEPQLISVPSHQQHASQQALQSSQSLLFNSYNETSAQGERPLWEAGAKPAAEMPLGDVARLFRDQRITSRKAVKSLEK
jgi:hypothetical protein